MLGRTLIGVRSASKKLAARLRNKPLTTADILGSVIKRPKNKSFFRSISDSIELRFEIFGGVFIAFVATFSEIFDEYKYDERVKWSFWKVGALSSWPALMMMVITVMWQNYHKILQCYFVRCCVCISFCSYFAVQSQGFAPKISLSIWC